MGNFINKESWLGQAQLRYVEELAWWNGVVSRREIVEKFGCSGQQASAILQGYLDLNPKALTYSLKVRRYLSAAQMTCVFGSPSFTQELEKEEDLVGQILLPLKLVDPEVPRYLMVAMRQRRAISMTYQSRSSETAEKREIIPHSFGFDGVRYHVRAWCPKNAQYRDFSLLRVKDIQWPERVVSEELPVDTAWEEFTEVRVSINKAVSAGVRLALMEDYGLSSVEEEIIIKCRVAMKPYVLYRMGVDTDGALPNMSFFQV